MTVLPRPWRFGKTWRDIGDHRGEHTRRLPRYCWLGGVSGWDYETKRPNPESCYLADSSGKYLPWRILRCHWTGFQSLQFCGKPWWLPCCRWRWAGSFLCYCRNHRDNFLLPSSFSFPRISCCSKFYSRSWICMSAGIWFPCPAVTFRGVAGEGSGF